MFFCKLFESTTNNSGSFGSAPIQKTKRKGLQSNENSKQEVLIIPIYHLQTCASRSAKEVFVGSLIQAWNQVRLKPVKFEL